MVYDNVKIGPCFNFTLPIANGGKRCDDEERTFDVAAGVKIIEEDCRLYCFAETTTGVVAARGGGRYKGVR